MQTGVEIQEIQNINTEQALLSDSQGNQYGPFDLVILNAGISATGKFEEIPADAYDRSAAWQPDGPGFATISVIDARIMTRCNQFNAESLCMLTATARTETLKRLTPFR